MPQPNLLQDIIILLVTSVVVIALFRRIHLPAVLGYLCVGMAVGPHGLGWIAESEHIHALGEFGMVFLLFTIGLEFSRPWLWSFKNTVLGLGGGQVLLTAGVIFAIAVTMGASPEAAFVISSALAMSSTAIAIKQLAEQQELHTRHGRHAVGILLFQDLAVIPILLILPILGRAHQQPLIQDLALVLGKGLITFLIIIGVGRWVLRPVFHEIAKSRSPELFMLTALMVTLLAAWGTFQAGLSLALGALMAGIMLGETEFRHQIGAELRPFRDLLMGLFFIAIGMYFDPHALPSTWPWVLASLLALMLFKAAVIAGLMAIMGNALQESLRTGLILAHIGEFGLVLFSLGLSLNLLDQTVFQTVLATTILSMALTPLLIAHNGTLAEGILAWTRASQPKVEDIPDESLKDVSDHTIICGYGRVGQHVARILDEEGLPFAALDLDPLHVRQAREAGDMVLYGDATRRDMLSAIGIHRARALVITFADITAALKILENLRALHANLPVLVRTHDETYLETLFQEGATEVFPETLEESLLLSSYLLLLLGFPLEDVLKRMKEVRESRYDLLRSIFHGTEPLALDQPPRRAKLHTLILPQGAYAVGRTLKELNLEAMGIKVTAVRRSGIHAPAPLPHTLIQAEDILILYGAPEALEQAEVKLLKG
ncbi:MAG: potassium transporter [Gammaproteobacteria bacterium]|nr:MAG: potassium transporter [Gammaproteobacteria bacterium]